MAKQKQQQEKTIVHNNRKGTLTLPGLGTLMPGANVCDTAAVELMKEKTTRQDGTSSIPGGAMTIDADEPVGTLGRNAQEAVALVKGTFDLALLTAWSDEDDRASVRKAINDQVEALTKEPEDDDDDE